VRPGGPVAAGIFGPLGSRLGDELDEERSAARAVAWGRARETAAGWEGARERGRERERERERALVSPSRAYRVSGGADVESRAIASLWAGDARLGADIYAADGTRRRRP
jgi:hypothetical protein